MGMWLFRIVLALPGAWITGRWTLAPETYGYGHAIVDSGDWAAWLLMATLAVTPLRLLFHRQAWTGWLLRRRRDLGLASFAYATGHTAIYLWKKGSLDIIVAEASESYLIAGWLALALFVPLAITSNNVSMRLLRRSWKRLHRLVYPAAIATFLHWVWSAFDPTMAWIHAGILAMVEIIRLGLQRRRRRSGMPLRA